MKENYTLVLGASTNPSRYSNIAIHRLVQHNQPVYAIGLKEGEVSGVKIQKGTPDLKNVETVTLYLNPSRQEAYYDYIIGLRPKRIIFNPGAENLALEKLAVENGIQAEVACTLVLLSTHQYGMNL